MKNVLSKIFILFGIILLSFSAYLFYVRNFSNRLYFNTKVNSVVQRKNRIPTKLLIPSLNKELNIYQSNIYGNKWEAFDSGVSYLESSPIPGAAGNSIMYGHNWKSILGDLYKVLPGDRIVIQYNDFSYMNFEIENTAIVKPTQIDVVKNTKDSRLTIYTCAGFLDSERFVVVAKPQYKSI